jgi:adenylate cyclase class 2
MRFEVEQKFRVEDASAVVARLREVGVSPGAAIVQVDQYFAHPARDFARTDEALRIRTIGGASLVTYKGPRLKGEVKARREIEFLLDGRDADGSQFAELLGALGFTPVAVVRKARREFEIARESVRVQGALDAVDGLGDFLELELVADEGQVAAAERVILSLAAELSLGAVERRSYLEMVLGK